MSEADLVYSDVKFTKTKEKPKESTSSPDEATYAQVKVSKNPPHVEQQPAGSQVPEERSKVKERAPLMVLCVLLAAAIIGLGIITFDNLQSKKKIDEIQTRMNVLENSNKSLTEENNVLMINLTEKQSQLQTCFTMKAIVLQPSEIILNGSCFKCEPGWEQHEGSCYYFSNNSLNWTQSRAECKRLGSDLVQINSSDEQTFLMLRLKEKMNDPEDKFWIGLTDSKEEGKWLWVDDSPLNNISLPFWSKNEPDNWTKNGEYPDGEDCARMGERGGAPDLKCWFDRICSAAQRGVCEKPAEAAQYRLKCY